MAVGIVDKVPGRQSTEKTVSVELGCPDTGVWSEG
jgi:hypothetical protein